jgi:hypothetical protein
MPTFPTHLGAGLHSDGGGAGISCALQALSSCKGVERIVLTLQL